MPSTPSQGMPVSHDDSFDYDAFVAAHWPSLPGSQARSVATYIYLGWAVVSIGKADEVNMEKSDPHELGYVRIDGTFRSA